MIQFPKQRYAKTQRLLRHADFERVYKQGRRHFASHMTVFYLARAVDTAAESVGSRVGFTVSKALGGAVQRNRMRHVLSPLFLPSCRYVPTCSEYALVAVDRHGAIRGSAIALWRLLRCHPFVRGGYDPVPDVGAGGAFPSSSLRASLSDERSQPTSA